MTQKKNIYLWSEGIQGKVVPILWFSAKTYFEEYGKTVDEWQWHDPFIHEWSDEKLFSYLEEHPPAIFGLSLYVWSEKKAKQLTETISKLYPKCKIIWGGPQIDIKYNGQFFRQHPEVSAVVPSDVYGEAILTDILDNFNSLKYQDIPEIYYQKAGMKFKSKIPFDKRSFVWPKNIFKAQKEYFNFDPKNTLIIYESTRGCPYKCSYCDWGGGTFTKTIKKPLETVLDELEFLAQQKMEWFYFADANFGIFKDRDIQIINHVAKLKREYGYPIMVNVENAKNNLDRVLEIQKTLIVNGLAPYYKISIQSVHDDIKKNIDRVDIPFDIQYEQVKQLQEEIHAPILIETILGLPGDNYQKTLETIEILEAKEIGSFRPAIWNLLPEAPAYAPEEREKWKIKTKWLKLFTTPYRIKPNTSRQEGVFALEDKNDIYFENVIETSSYDRFEWCDMLILSMISGTAKQLGLSRLLRYLKTEENITVSSFYHQLYTKLVKEEKFIDPYLNKQLGGLPKKLYDLVSPDKDYQNFELDPGPKFPGLLSPMLYFLFIVMLKPAEFYKSIENILIDQIKNKEKFIDLIDFLINVFIDIDYDPANPREFNTLYNWVDYFNNKTTTKSYFKWRINDTGLDISSATEFKVSDYPLIKDYDKRIEQFFYHRAMNMTRPKYSENVELLN